VHDHSGSAETRKISVDGAQIREQTLDEIERLVATTRGASCGNPRYFAEMFAGTMSANPTDEAIALDEIAEAVRRIARRQTIAQAQALVTYAAQMVADL
jgi:hypothetical protein